MAKPSPLLKEAILVLKAIKNLNFGDFNDPNPATDDPEMIRVGKRINRVLNKAAKLKAA